MTDDNSTYCRKCSSLVDEARHVIEKNFTTNVIVTILEKICDLVPLNIKPIIKMCDEYVEASVPKFINELKNALNSTRICTDLFLCNSSAIKAYSWHLILPSIIMLSLRLI